MADIVSHSRRSGVDMQNNTPAPVRIPNDVFMNMIKVAVVLDIIGAIPALNVIVTACAAILFNIWWWKRGLGLISGKKIAQRFIPIVLEFIPFVSILPSIVTMVIVVFAVSRAEEKSGISLTGKKPGSVLVPKRQSFVARNTQKLNGGLKRITRGRFGSKKQARKDARPQTTLENNIVGLISKKKRNQSTGKEENLEEALIRHVA